MNNLYRKILFMISPNDKRSLDYIMKRLPELESQAMLVAQEMALLNAELERLNKKYDMDKEENLDDTNYKNN